MQEGQREGDNSPDRIPMLLRVVFTDVICPEVIAMDECAAGLARIDEGHDPAEHIHAKANQSNDLLILVGPPKNLRAESTLLLVESTWTSVEGAPYWKTACRASRTAPRVRLRLLHEI